MAKDRGHYSSTYDLIYDCPEYEALSQDAASVWWALKHWPSTSSGYNIGILHVYREPLSHRSKVPMERLQAAVRELEDGEWIVTEGRWVWLRNHLKFDPHYRPENAKHVKGVQNAIAALPRLDIVDRFVAYYRGQENAAGVPFLPRIQTASRIGGESNQPADGIAVETFPVSVTSTTSVTGTSTTSVGDEFESSFGVLLEEARCPACRTRCTIRAAPRGQGYFCGTKLGGCGQTFDLAEGAILKQLTERARNAILRRLEANAPAASPPPPPEDPAKAEAETALWRQAPEIAQRFLAWLEDNRRHGEQDGVAYGRFADGHDPPLPPSVRARVLSLATSKARRAG